jgi:GT2 family glycosyltransferase
MTLAKSPCVFIIVLNWNGWEDTCECLHSLEKLDYPNYEAVVVDNGSINYSVQNIKREFPGIKVIALAENSGFAAGNNVGIRYAMENDADYCWILNNDTVVDQKALCHLVNKMENDSAVGICGSKVIYYHQPDTIQVLAGGSYNKWIGVPKNFGQHKPSDMDIDAQKVEEKLDFIIGASMLVSRSFLEDVGLLCEDYFLYYEEIDWGLRAKGKYEFGFAPECIIYHKEGASIGATNRNINEKSRLSDYYHIKNRLKIAYKFFPWLLPLNYLTCIYSIFNRMRRNQWDRIPMILRLFFTFNNSKKYEN